MLSIKIAARVIGVNLALTAVAIYLLPFGAFKLKYGKFSLTDNEIKQIASGLDVRQAHGEVGFKEAITSRNKGEIYCNQPHPVIGWIDICSSSEFWGFSQVTKKEKAVNTYRLLLVGGSVANYLGNSGNLGNALRDRFKQLGDERTVEIFNAALPGFKQPQQLAVINALISSGWKFDAIVNISGNNEIAFAANHLFVEGYNPLLPYAHPERTLMAAKMLYKPQDECKRQSIASWHPISQYMKIRCYRESLGKMKSFVHFQPYLSAMRYKDDIPTSQDEAIDRALSVWLNSSRSSYAIAGINGIRYLEVIQPSQYLDGSKRFSPEEERLVRSDKALRVVGKGYSRVKTMDFGLMPDSILDARYVFVDEQEPVYSDNCCHLNQVGEQILSHEIAKKLIP